MTRLVTCSVWIGLGACSGSAEEDTSDDDGGGTRPEGACGDVSYVDGISAFGEVVDANGAPVAGAAVTLDERVWDNRSVVYGTGTTDAEGKYAFDVDHPDVAGLTSVEECWGTAIDYWVTA